MHQLGFKNPLQRLEAVFALEPAYGDAPVRRSESIKQDAARDGDLVADLAVARAVSSRLAAGAGHPRREPECERPAIQRPPAGALQEALVVKAEEGLQVPGMNARE